MNLELFEVGFNIPAKVGMDFNEIQTPSLIIDYKIFEDNISKMKQFVLNNNVKLRPHAKMHKSVDVAKYQIDKGGAHGICCQKLSEAEIFVKAGIKDVLITNQITDAFKLERLAKIASKETKIGCCVDNKENIFNIQKAVQRNNSEIDIYIEYDCGANRCGIKSFNEINELIETTKKMANLNFIGFQAYNGSIQHIEDYKIRQKKVKNTCKKIRELKSNFIKYSPFITGVGTGCFDLEVHEEVYDEIQVGSYAFMDAHYSSLKHDRKLNNSNNFENSLFILAGVMSKALEKHAVVDAGLKSIAVDSGLPKTTISEIEYIKCSDEHGIIADPDDILKINDKIRLIPGHCDPTCNLHNWYVVVKDTKVIDLWPISARGYSF